MPGSTVAARSIRPGAVTQLLADLIRAPRGAGWDVPLLPGDHVGRFEILREVGRGGFGVVYEARDAELGRSVAFKAVRADQDALADARRLGEAEAAARLAHPNIVHLYDVGRCDQGAFLILELLRGRPLSEWTGQPVALRDAVRVALDIARGLAHAHAAGVVHRDLKPANVFVCDDGQVKVLDFGLAHVFGRPVLDGGTPAYMAPEQARGETGDERSDLFSLGVILDELLPKERPGALGRLVTRLRSEDPAARPSSAAEVEAELARVQRSLQPRKLLWATSIVAALAVAAAVVLALRARPLPPGRLLTAIADTANSTGDADLDGVSELLGAGLQQTRRLSLLPRARLLNALREAGEPSPSILGEAKARRAAERALAQLVLVPSVASAEAGYRVSLTALDLARGETHFTLVEPFAAKASLPRAIHQLVQRARRALKEDPAAPPARGGSVVELAPAHPEALRHYAEGRRLGSEGRYREAIAAHRRALDLDPEFLLPRLAVLEHLRLGDVFMQETIPYFSFEGQRENAEILRRNLERLPPGDAAWVESGLVDVVAPTDQEAVRLLDRVIEAWPEDPRAYLEAAQRLLYNNADVAAARPYMEKAIASAPVQQRQAIDFLLYLHRLDEALARARAWADGFPSAAAFGALAEVHRQRGETAQALEAARRGAVLAGPGGASKAASNASRPLVNRDPYVDADALEEFEALLGPAADEDGSWLRRRGRFREALALTERRRPAADAPWYERVGYYDQRALALLPAGGEEALLADMQAVLRVGMGWFQCEAWKLALVGDAERAERLATYGPFDRRMVCAAIVRAIAASRRGERDAALAILAPYTIAVADYYRGEILGEQGRDREAAEAFRRYRLHRGVNFWEGMMDSWLLPNSLYLEAAARERLGDRQEALALVDRLLHLWARADPDLPLLARAKALRARLAAAPAP